MIIKLTAFQLIVQRSGTVKFKAHHFRYSPTGRLHLDIEMTILFILYMHIQNDALLSDDARIQIRIEDGAFLYLDSGNTFNDGVAGVHRAFILTGKGVLKK